MIHQTWKYQRMSCVEYGEHRTRKRKKTLLETDFRESWKRKGTCIGIDSILYRTLLQISQELLETYERFKTLVIRVQKKHFRWVSFMHHSHWCLTFNLDSPSRVLIANAPRLPADLR